MKKREMNSTPKTIEVEYTEKDIDEIRQKGVSGADLPKPGIHKFRRSRFVSKRSEQKIKVTMLLDADIIDFFKERAAKGKLPYQTQINQELRSVVEKLKSPRSEAITLEMLENPRFLAELATKLKLAA